MISYLGSLVQSCYGEGGALQTDIAVCGEHSPCSGHTGFAPYRGVCAFPVYTAQAPSCSIWSVPCTACGSSLRAPHKERTRLHLCFVPSLVPAAQAARSLRGALSPGAAHPLPSAAPASVSAPAGRVPAACVCSQELASSRDPPGWQMLTIQNLRMSLNRNWRPICSVGGDAISGAEFAPFPSPLPPASGGAGPVCHRLALLWTC